MKEIVESAAVAVRPLFSAKDLYLEMETAEPLPLVLCDPTRIREVVLNLLSNAGRFTDVGGATIRAGCQDGNIVVSVADTGAGIAEEDQANLFQPFHQLDTNLRRRASGTGLGLSISKHFVELHDGRMWVESKLGRGTTVFFQFPVNPPMTLGDQVLRWFNPYEPYEERTRRSMVPKAGLRPRMLIVDRRDAIGRLLRRYLDGMEIVTVETVERAAQEAERSPANAVLINDLSVQDALGQLSKSVSLPYGVPAMIFSVPGVEQAIDKMAVANYIVKPVSREALLAAIDHLERDVHTILVIDDEPDALRLFGRMLESAEQGYRVLRASTGQQGLDVLRQDRPDVILLDLIMPEMDGYRFLTIQRQEPALRDIPVILISARDPQGEPIVSRSLTVTSQSGLSAAKLLACIEALTPILSAAGQTGDPGRTETFSG